MLLGVHAMRISGQSMTQMFSGIRLLKLMIIVLSQVLCVLQGQKNHIFVYWHPFQWTTVGWLMPNKPLSVNLLISSHPFELQPSFCYTSLSKCKQILVPWEISYPFDKGLLICLIFWKSIEVSWKTWKEPIIFIAFFIRQASILKLYTISSMCTILEKF